MLDIVVPALYTTFTRLMIQQYSSTTSMCEGTDTGCIRTATKCGVLSPVIKTLYDYRVSNRKEAKAQKANVSVNELLPLKCGTAQVAPVARRRGVRCNVVDELQQEFLEDHVDTHVRYLGSKRVSVKKELLAQQKKFTSRGFRGKFSKIGSKASDDGREVDFSSVKRLANASRVKSGTGGQSKKNSIVLVHMGVIPHSSIRRTSEKKDELMRAGVEQNPGPCRNCGKTIKGIYRHNKTLICPSCRVVLEVVSRGFGLHPNCPDAIDTSVWRRSDVPSVVETVRERSVNSCVDLGFSVAECTRPEESQSVVPIQPPEPKPKIINVPLTCTAHVPLILTPPIGSLVSDSIRHSSVNKITTVFNSEYTSVANSLPTPDDIQACDIDTDVKTVVKVEHLRAPFVIPFVLPSKDAPLVLLPLDGYHATIEDAHAVLSRMTDRLLFRADIRLCNPRVLSFNGDNRMSSSYCVSPIKRSMVVSSFMTTTYTCRLFGTCPKNIVVEYIPHLVSELISSYSHGSSMDAARASIRLKSRSLAALPIKDSDYLVLINGSERLALLKISQDFFGGGMVLLPSRKTPF